MARINTHHEVLDENGVGKCSVPMWRGGMPAGFCDEPAYGNRTKEYIDRCIARREYEGYCPALACPSHGGPFKPVKKEVT